MDESEVTSKMEQYDSSNRHHAAKNMYGGVTRAAVDVISIPTSSASQITEIQECNWHNMGPKPYKAVRAELDIDKEKYK